MEYVITVASSFLPDKNYSSPNVSLFHWLLDRLINGFRCYRDRATASSNRGRNLSKRSNYMEFEILEFAETERKESLPKLNSKFGEKKEVSESCVESREIVYAADPRI